ncbi:hypothetical protein Aduo_016296 [Ancylostoma duodenale]
MSEQSQIVNPAEFEAFPMDEPKQCEQLASSKMRLHNLMCAVQDIAKQNMAQMTLSLKTMRDRIEALRNLSSLLERQVDGGSGEEVANLARACIDSECSAIDSELGKLRKVEEQLKKTADLVTRALPSTINEVLAQLSCQVVSGPSSARPEEPAITYAHSEYGNLQDQPGSDPIADVRGSQRVKIGSQLPSRVILSSSPTGSGSQRGFDNSGPQFDVGTYVRSDGFTGSGDVQ